MGAVLVKLQLNYSQLQRHIFDSCQTGAGWGGRNMQDLLESTPSSPDQVPRLACL